MDHVTDGRPPGSRSGGGAVVVAVNPTAGRGRGRRAGGAAVHRLRERGLDVRPLHAPDGQSLAKDVAAAVAEEPDALVVVGGDGMVHLGVNAVAGSRVPLGVVPAGTGNDCARVLGLPVTDPVAAADVAAAALLAGTHRAVDTARYTGPDGSGWFAGVLAGGFDAIVNDRANRWRWPRGRLRYDLALFRELPVFRPRSYELELDGVAEETRAMLLAVGNGPSYGGGMLVCPDARLDDGLLDVLVVEPVSRLELLRIFPRVYSGRHVDHPRVSVRQARRVRLAAPGIIAHADGERLGPLPLECEAVPGALRLLAPTDPMPSDGRTGTPPAG
ncbi:MAG: diacylglycerol kinase [Actinomycetales bacterium]|nr:diacylglycerol kinase [Actinomycetales bacterium]